MTTTQAELAKLVVNKMSFDETVNFAEACLIDIYLESPTRYVDDCLSENVDPTKLTYRVGIREVHVSMREVKARPMASNESIIRLALDEGNEVEMGYSHTLDSENHTVEIVE